MTTSDAPSGASPGYPLDGIPVLTTRLVRESTVPYSKRIKIEGALDAADLLRAYFHDKDREELVALLLCDDMTVIGIATISVGVRDGATAHPTQIFKAAFLANARYLILGHNHVDGNEEPSKEDVEVTRSLMEAGKLLGLPVLDHLIIGDERVASVRDSIETEEAEP